MLPSEKWHDLAVEDPSPTGWSDSNSSEHPGIDEAPSYQHFAHGEQSPIPGTIIIDSVDSYSRYQVSSLSPLSISFEDLMRDTTTRSLIALPGCFDIVPSPSKAQQDQQWRFEDYLQTIIDHRYFDRVTMTLDDRSYSYTLFLNVDLVKIVTKALRKSTCVDLTVELDGQSLVALGGSSDELNTCPQLRDFRWTSENIGIGHELPRMYHLPWRSLKRGLFWQQLTNLSLQCPLSVDDAIYVLSQGARSLQSAQLASINRQDAGILIQQRITLPQLHSLDIRSYISLRDLFSKLRMPALTNLSLRADTAGMMGDAQILDHRLSIRWGLLKDLTLEKDSHQVCDVGLILFNAGRSSALRRLTLSCPDGSFKADSIPPLPYLTHLTHLTLDVGAPCDKLLKAFRGKTIPRLELAIMPRSYLSIPPVNGLIIKDSITLDDLFQLLQRQEYLQHGSFSVRDGGDLSTFVDQVRLGELKHLDLVSSSSLYSLWDLLQAPAITKLNLRFHDLEIIDPLLELEYVKYNFAVRIKAAVYHQEARALALTF